MDLTRNIITNVNVFDALTGSVKFSLTYPPEEPLPTNASLEIFYGDGSTERHEIRESMSQMQDGQLNFEHTYEKSGKYKTMFTLTNQVSALTLKKESFLLRRIHGLGLQVKMKDSSQMDGFGKNRDRFPASKIIEFKLNVEDGDVERFVIEHNGQMFKETTLDRVQFSSQEVRQYMLPLSPSLLSTRSERQEKNAMNPQNVFPHHVHVSLYCPLVRTVYSGNLRACLLTPHAQTGWHNFTFFAFNRIQKRSEPVVRNVYLMDAITGLAVDDISNVTEPMTKKFRIRLQSVGTDACLLVSFADPSDQPATSATAFGNEITCRETYPSVHMRMESEKIEPMIEIEHTYQIPGNYVVTFMAGNHLPHRELIRTPVMVMEIDCRPPIVLIKNPVDDFRNGSVFWKSRPIQLYAKSFLDCNATCIVKRFWTGSRLHPKSGKVVKEIDLTDVDSSTKTFLYIPPFFLPAGVYRFTFNVHIISPDNSHPLLPFREQASTHVQVVPSPVIGQMTDGAQSRIIRGSFHLSHFPNIHTCFCFPLFASFPFLFFGSGWGQKIVLSPGNYSIDPDDGMNKKFTIRWFCRRIPGETIERNIRDSDQPVSSPLNPQRGFSLTDATDDDVGGCFGKGPGMINIVGGTVEWDTRVFYAPAMTYEIIVRIDSPDRDPSWTGIQLVLLERKPPSIQVKCQTPALCYPHVPIGQKINPVRVGLIGVCSEDCSGSLKYEWSIHGKKKDGTDVLLKEASEFVVGAYEEKMALGIEFFKKYYPSYMDFFAKLSVTNEEGDRGESDIFLHVNQPPEGGECQLMSSPPSPSSSSSSGEEKHQVVGETRALLDKLFVSCSGWIDPDSFKPIEHYAFWLHNHKTDTVTFLMYGPDQQSELILPYGNFTLGVDIKDREGSLTRINISDISTSAPTKQEYDQFMQTKALESADAAGDQSLMNMVTQAATSLMNAKMRDLEAEAVMASTTTTTTTTTTMSPADKEAWLAKRKEQQAREGAETRAKMVKSVESIMNMDPSLNALEQIGSVLTAVAGKGKGVDNEAKEIVIRLLKKTVSLASQIQVESPQQLLDFCMFAVGTMGGIVNVSPFPTSCTCRPRSNVSSLSLSLFSIFSHSCQYVFPMNVRDVVSEACD